MNSSFSCKSCDKKYKQLKGLKLHIKAIHEKLKEFSCKSCGKSFTQSHSLRRHTKIVHEGQKLHKCYSCDSSFTQSHSLKIHRKSFHDIKDFKIEGKKSENNDKFQYNQSVLLKTDDSTNLIQTETEVAEDFEDGSQSNLLELKNATEILNSFEDTNEDILAKAGVVHEGENKECKREVHTETELENGIKQEMETEVDDESINFRQFDNETKSYPVKQEDERTKSNSLEYSNDDIAEADDVHDGENKESKSGVHKETELENGIKIKTETESDINFRQFENGSKSYSDEQKDETEIVNSFEYSNDDIEKTDDVHDGENKESKRSDILKETEEENGTKNLKNNLLLELVAYACQSCGKKFTKITQLSKHIKSVHKELKFVNGIKQKMPKSLPESPIYIEDSISELAQKFRKIPESPKNSNKNVKAESKFKKQKVIIDDSIKSHIRNSMDFLANTENEIKTEDKLSYSLFKALHAGENDKIKSHKCHICEKVFGLLVNLENHMESFHKIKLLPKVTLTKIKNYKCDFCEKSFDQLMNLENHIQRNHKVSNDTAVNSGDFQNEKMNVEKVATELKPDPELNSQKSSFED